MKQPTFFEGVTLAFAASLVGSALYTALMTALPGAWVVRGITAGLGLVYVVYLLTRSRERVGRTTALTAWTAVAGAAWFIEPPLGPYVLVHLGLIWLIRSLYFYSSVLSALADLGLTALGLAAAVWAATQSGSIFLSIWCFFLVQALFVAIPNHMRGRTGNGQPHRDGQDRFDRAHRAAEAALRKLPSIY